MSKSIEEEIEEKEQAIRATSEQLEKETGLVIKSEDVFTDR